MRPFTSWLPPRMKAGFSRRAPGQTKHPRTRFRPLLEALENRVLLCAPEAVPSVFSTGVNDSHVPLDATSADPHYAIVASAGTFVTSPSSFVGTTKTTDPTNVAWVPNSATSHWISPK